MTIEEFVRRKKSFEGKWTPISKELPPEAFDVLVTYAVTGIKGKKRRYVEIASHYDGEWSSVTDEFLFPRTVVEYISWMPIPDPDDREVTT